MKHYKNAKRIAKLLDSQFSFLGFKFGIEPIVGLVPFIGDNITLFLSLYLFYAGYKMNLPRKALIQMLFNIGLDFLIGTIPIFGDVADFFYRASERNMKILDKYYKN